jgi:hypothetical protein
MPGRSKLALAEMARARLATELELVGGQRLRVERGAHADSITLLAANGALVVSLRVTEEGPVLRFESGLVIEASGDLELAGRRVAIRGREGLAIESGGDAAIEVAGELTTRAREQTVEARLGDVKVKANDDVKLVGERVRLNC